MEALLQLIKNVKKTDPKRVFTNTFKQNGLLMEFVISENIWRQLYEQGVDSKGHFLGHYQPSTILIKKDAEKSHITLKETGAFYESFKGKIRFGEIEIDADGRKGSDNLFEIWGDDILGLTDEGKERLIDLMINENLKEVVLEAYTKGME